MAGRRLQQQLVIRGLGAAVIIALVVAGIVKAAHPAPATQAPLAVFLVVVLVLGWWRLLLWRGLAPFDDPAPPPARQPERRAAGSGDD